MIEKYNASSSNRESVIFTALVNSFFLSFLHSRLVVRASCSLDMLDHGTLATMVAQ